MIIEVDNNNINDATIVYKKSWYESHKDICTPSFLKKHTMEHQRKFLEKKIETGWNIFINYKNFKAIGIVGLNYKTGEIGLLYILPSEFRKGYGRELLNLAVKEVSKYNNPFVIVLNINKRAIYLYEKYGFSYSGEEKVLSIDKGISELKYKYILWLLKKPWFWKYYTNISIITMDIVLRIAENNNVIWWIRNLKTLYYKNYN